MLHASFMNDTAHTLRYVFAYGCALVSPVLIMIFCTRAEMPAFVFEHAMVLLIVCIALPFGIGPAVVTAIVATLGSGFLLIEPAGVTALTSERVVLDTLLFLVVALTVGGLVATARWEKARAEAAMARERQARDERESLVAVVTHELAEPLSALRNSIEFVRQPGASVRTDTERLWSRLNRAASRATSLIRTLQDALTLDHGALSVERQRFDLRSLIRGVVQLVDRVSKRHPVALLLPNHPVIVDGDSDRLHRVLENLVSNAIRYSPDGGAVEIALVVSNGEGVVTVKDHGIGISPETLVRIFQRGYRSPEARAIAPGLGMGLNISREIVIRHGGSLDLIPGQSTGAMFTLRLPVVDVATDHDSHPAA
jgi:signal transduction histidine kinase